MQVAEHLDADGLVQAADQDRFVAARADQVGDQVTRGGVVGGVEQDRTLGFLFGLARGLLIVVVAYEFFIWLVPDKQRPDWVVGAKSRTMLDSTGEWLKGLLPDDPENTILKRFKKNKPEDEQTDADQAAPGSGDGYSKPARDSLKKLIEKPAAR